MAQESGAALAVLVDGGLLAHIAQFQRGVPQAIHDLVVRHTATLPYRLQFKLWPAVMVLGDLYHVQLLYRLRSRRECTEMIELMVGGLPQSAMTFGRLDVLQWFHENGLERDQWDRGLMAQAVNQKQFEIAQWLLDNRPDTCETWLALAIKRAVEHGQLELLVQILPLETQPIDTGLLDLACTARQWHIGRYLHRVIPSECLEYAQRMAARRNDVEAIEFLQEFDAISTS